jgi:hypothetical protein
MTAISARTRRSRAILSPPRPEADRGRRADVFDLGRPSGSSPLPTLSPSAPTPAASHLLSSSAPSPARRRCTPACTRSRRRGHPLRRQPDDACYACVTAVLETAFAADEWARLRRRRRRRAAPGLGLDDRLAPATPGVPGDARAWLAPTPTWCCSATNLCRALPRPLASALVRVAQQTTSCAGPAWRDAAVLAPRHEEANPRRRCGELAGRGSHPVGVSAEIELPTDRLVAGGELVSHGGRLRRHSW